jgi:hypothetical protein
MEFVGPWASRPGFIGAYVFGSMAMPYGEPESDIDLGIVVEDDAFREIPMSGRRQIVVRGGGKDADVWCFSRSQIERTQLEVTLHALANARIVVDERLELAPLLDRVSTMSETTREERLRVHYFELAYGTQRLRSASRRGKTAVIRALCAGLVEAAAKLLFVVRGRWPGTTSWVFEELALEGVEPETIELMKRVLEANDPREVRQLRASIDRALLARGVRLVEDPERLIEWNFLTAEGQAAQARWAGIGRLGA